MWVIGIHISYNYLYTWMHAVWCPCNMNLLSSEYTSLFSSECISCSTCLCEACCWLFVYLLIHTCVRFTMFVRLFGILKKSHSRFVVFSVAVRSTVFINFFARFLLFFADGTDAWKLPSNLASYIGAVDIWINRWVFILYKEYM